MTRGIRSRILGLAPDLPTFAKAVANGFPVQDAQSFGIPGFRPASAADLSPPLMRALAVKGPSLVDVPIDHAENVRLTERLGMLTE